MARLKNAGQLGQSGYAMLCRFREADYANSESLKERAALAPAAAMTELDHGSAPRARKADEWLARGLRQLATDDCFGNSSQIMVGRVVR